MHSQTPIQPFYLASTLCIHNNEVLLYSIIMVLYIGVGMTRTLGGLIQYHVQFMCSIIACLMYDQATLGGL